jgi:hypothetical protein
MKKTVLLSQGSESSTETLEPPPSRPSMIGENDEYVDPVQHPSLSCLTQSHPENRPSIRIFHGGKPKFVHSERSAAFRAHFFRKRLKCSGMIGMADSPPNSRCANACQVP